MTLPPNPTLFLAHCQARMTLTQSQRCQELKMETHIPPNVKPIKKPVSAK